MATSKPVGTWTYDDLFNLPDDGRRYEIIDGVLFELPSVGTTHAIAVMNLILLLSPTVRATGGRLFTGPLDVFMAGADPVQPDIVVLTSGNLGPLRKRGIEGAPDLLVEVLCPLNPEHGRIRKRALYARGRVPEYWLVSPEAATIEVLVLEGDTYRTLVRAGGDEPIRSVVLPELSFSVSAVFAFAIA
jgi:Uma2 family endonuclease